VDKPGGVWQSNDWKIDKGVERLYIVENSLNIKGKSGGGFQEYLS